MSYKTDWMTIKAMALKLGQSALSISSKKGGHSTRYVRGVFRVESKLVDGRIMMRVRIPDCVGCGVAPKDVRRTKVIDRKLICARCHNALFRDHDPELISKLKFFGPSDSAGKAATSSGA